MKKLELKQMENLEGGDGRGALGNLAMGSVCGYVGFIVGVAASPLGGFLAGVSCGFIFGGGLKEIW
jgi:hypothetical protein